MVIKPVEFAMIQQQNNVAKSQYNAENRPMTEQQTITQQVQKDINVHSQQVNKKDNADNETMRCGGYNGRNRNISYSGWRNMCCCQRCYEFWR